jgi:hypothetical protein
MRKTNKYVKSFLSGSLNAIGCGMIKYIFFFLKFHALFLLILFACYYVSVCGFGGTKKLLMMNEVLILCNIKKFHIALKFI